MNTKHLIVTVAMIAATGSAFAQRTEWVDPAAGFVSTKARADVTAELNQAQAEGAFVVGGAETEELKAQLAKTSRSTPQRAAAQGKTRAEVYNELVQAEGTYIVGGEEFPGQTQLATRAVPARGDATGYARKANSKSGVSGS